MPDTRCRPLWKKPRARRAAVSGMRFEGESAAQNLLDFSRLGSLGERDFSVSTTFDDRWRTAMTSYQAAVADYERAAEIVSQATQGGHPPAEAEIQKEELAHTRLVETRRAMFRLLYELRAPRDG
jgi:hypothetical protein